jgi:hypothetical protein
MNIIIGIALREVILISLFACYSSVNRRFIDEQTNAKWRQNYPVRYNSADSPHLIDFLNR